MANKTIPDLTAGTDVVDADLFEKCDDPAGTPASQKVTALMIKNYIAAQPLLAGEYTLQDDAAIEYFDDYALGAITVFDQGSGWLSNGVGSGASIVSKTMADGGVQQRLNLNAGSYGRAMPWGAFWNRVKIVVLVRINNGANIANINGYFGICSGTTNMVNSATTTNFVGIRWGDGTGTATFTAGTKISYYNAPNFRAASRRVNTTTDRGALSSGHSISANEGYLSPIIVEFSRPVFANDASSINYSIAEASPNSTTVEQSRNKLCSARSCLGDVVLASLANSSSDTAISGQSGVTCTPFAFDQSTGVLDTVNIYWPQALNFEIAAIVVRKVY